MEPTHRQSDNTRILTWKSHLTKWERNHERYPPKIHYRGKSIQHNMNFTDSTSYKEVYIVMAPQPLYKFRSQYNIFEPLIIMDLALWDVFIYSVEQCYEDVLAWRPLCKFRSQYNFFKPLLIADLALSDASVHSVEQGLWACGFWDRFCCVAETLE
jgi:hypothetical protein